MEGAALFRQKRRSFKINEVPRPFMPRQTVLEVSIKRTIGNQAKEKKKRPTGSSQEKAIKAK